jgi:hypothetical protein
MDKQQKEVLKRWWDGLHFAMQAHYAASVKASRSNYWLGIPVVLTSTFVGSAVFATLESEPSVPIKIGTAVLSLTASFLAAVQTFLRFAERAESHREAATNYAVIQRDLAQLLAFPPKEGIKLLRSVNSIRERWDALVTKCPTVPKRIWNQAAKKRERSDQKARRRRSAK